jgi:serine/threonine protein kinase
MSPIETGSYDPRALQSGAQLSQYIIERTLGMGGFGITYLARHETLSNKLVAIKEFMPRDEAFRDKDDIIRLNTESLRHDFEIGLENFFREAKNLFNLTQGDDPSLANIVKVEDVFHHNDTAYMVMEYVEGDSLESMVRGMVDSGTKLSEEKLLAIFGQIASALGFMHSRKLLHRDITPSNIIVRRTDNKPVLIDFGSARSPAGYTVVATTHRPETTQYTRVVFTPGYAPIEQSEGLEQDERTDIYSLAATMYHLTTRSKPIPAAARRGTIDEGKPDPMEPAVEAGSGSGYSKALLEAIDAGLSLRMRDRPDSIDEWLSELGILHVQEQPSDPTLGPPVLDWKEIGKELLQRAESLDRRYVGAAAAALVVVILAVWSLMPGIPDLLDKNRMILVESPFQTEARQEARQGFLKVQLDNDASEDEVEQATAAVEICDLLASYDDNTESRDLVAARSDLAAILAQVPTAGFGDVFVNRVQIDFDFESGIFELRELLDQSGLGAELDAVASDIVEKMRPAGEADARFAAAAETLEHVIKAANDLNDDQFDVAINSLVAAQQSSGGMGYDPITFTLARGVVADERILHVKNGNLSAVIALLEGPADANVLARANAVYSESLRVAAKDAIAQAGLSLTQSLQDLIAALPSASPENLVSEVQALRPVAVQAEISEADWQRVIQAYRQAQQWRRLAQIRQGLMASPVGGDALQEARRILGSVKDDVASFGLGEELASESNNTLKAIAALELVNRRIVANDYEGAASQLNRSAETIAVMTGGEEIFAIARSAVGGQLSADIETRWEATRDVLSAWRAPARTNQLKEFKQRVLQLDPKDGRAVAAGDLITYLDEINSAVANEKHADAFASLSKTIIVAERLDLDLAFSTENRRWLQDTTLAYAQDMVDAAYSALTKSPTDPDVHERINAQLSTADQLIDLSDQQVQDTAMMRRVMAPLTRISRALETGTFSNAEALAAEAVAGVTIDRFNASLLKLRLDSLISNWRTNFAEEVAKSVTAKANDIHAAVEPAAIDLDALADARSILESLAPLRNNPEVAYDWSTVQDIETTLNALTQARNIANSYEFLQASKLLADTSVALQGQSRWRRLLLKGVTELEALKQETISNLLTEAGDRTNANPFSAATLDASVRQYETVKQIEAVDDGLGAMGIEFIAYLRSIAGPIQGKDFAWMQKERKQLVVQGQKYTKLPSAFKTMLVIARDVDEIVDEQIDQAQKSLAGVFTEFEFDGSNGGIYTQKLRELARIGQEARSKGLDNIVAIVEVTRARIDRMNTIVTHLQNKRLHSANQLVRQAVDDSAAEILGADQAQILKNAENGLRSRVISEYTRTLVSNNQRLGAVFDTLAENPLDSQAMSKARDGVDAILAIQADFPDALNARLFLSALNNSAVANRCQSMSQAARVADDFEYPSFNLSWLDQMIASDCR